MGFINNKGERMSEQLLDEGRYKAAPESWGITKTKDSKPCVFIEFKLECGPIMTWYGHLIGKNDNSTAKCREITSRALVNCGFAYKELSMLDRYDALNKDDDVSLVISHEVDQRGKPRAKISWVNKSGISRVDKAEADILLSGIDLRADLMEAMQEQGVTEKPKGPMQQGSEIPF